MEVAQNLTGEHYRMDEGRKRVLAIVAGILVAAASQDPRGPGRQPTQPENGVPDLVRCPVGRSNHAKD